MKIIKDIVNNLNEGNINNIINPQKEYNIFINLKNELIDSFKFKDEERYCNKLKSILSEIEEKLNQIEKDIIKIIDKYEKNNFEEILNQLNQIKNEDIFNVNFSISDIKKDNKCLIVFKCINIKR